MIWIFDTTALIYFARIGILLDLARLLEPLTTPMNLYEATRYSKYSDSEVIKTVDQLELLKKEKPNIKKEELNFPSGMSFDALESCDIMILLLAIQHKKEGILVSDDKKLRKVAKYNAIKTLYTPEVLEYVGRKGIMKAEDVIIILDNLKNIYIRKKVVEKAQKSLKKKVIDMPKTKNISLSLPEDIVDEAYLEAKKSYASVKENSIIDTYKTGKYSFAKIAKLTGSSVPEVLDILAKYKIKEEVSEEDLKEGKKILESLLNN